MKFSNVVDMTLSAGIEFHDSGFRREIIGMLHECGL